MDESRNLLDRHVCGWLLRARPAVGALLSAPVPSSGLSWSRCTNKGSLCFDQYAGRQLGRSAQKWPGLARVARKFRFGGPEPELPREPDASALLRVTGCGTNQVCRERGWMQSARDGVRGLSACAARLPVESSHRPRKNAAWTLNLGRGMPRKAREPR